MPLQNRVWVQPLPLYCQWIDVEPDLPIQVENKTLESDVVPLGFEMINTRRSSKIP